MVPLIWYTRDSEQEWKNTSRSVSSSTITDMRSASPFRILWHRLNHCVTLCGTIQALYNFLEASLILHALFVSTEVKGEGLRLTLKSLSVTRWSCRWETVKTVYGQMKRIVKAVLALLSDKDPKTYSERSPLSFIDIPNSSQKLNFVLFADDTNMLYADRHPKSLEETVNKLRAENVCQWLHVNKLTLKVIPRFCTAHPFCA